MISLTIRDTKVFMSHLLIKDTFDKLLLSEATIATANTYNINGAVNKDFFTKEELSELSETEYTPWSRIKPFCFSLVKGSKVPSGMKLVFLLPHDMVEKLLTDSNCNFNVSDVNGLFLNIRYADGTVTIITGTSLNIFSLDKSLEHFFDSYIKSFLDGVEINYEQL